MPDSATVRRAGDADVPVLARLRRAWVEEQHGGPLDDPAFETSFTEWYAEERSRRVSWLAEVAGEAVGMLDLTVFRRMPKPAQATGRWAYVSNVFVLAAYRNRGIGARLLDAAMSYAAERDFVRVVLAPSERSVPFYRRAGFRDPDMLLVHPDPRGVRR